ncbi:unnamed protein product [Rhodiola kirilowii]
MASLRNPKTWAPYINTKDCSQGFCSLYCPQWCYIIFPPPPPFEYRDADSGSMFSPLVIAIIGVLASAFLLVSYYVIFTKFCKDRGSNRPEHQVEEMEMIHQVPALHESWHFTANNGLDEALIKLITVCQYKRGDGLVEGTECSVCLSVFEEGERLRLLPKCSHAFHLPCIDMWLKSHSNCPLCRANIISVTVVTARSQEPPLAEAENSVQSQPDPQLQPQDENVAAREDRHDEGSGVVAIASNAAAAALKSLLSPESQMVSDRIGKAGYGSKGLPSVARPITMTRSFSRHFDRSILPQTVYERWEERCTRACAWISFLFFPFESRKVGFPLSAASLLMASSEPSYDQWPRLLASHESKVQPKAPVVAPARGVSFASVVGQSTSKARNFASLVAPSSVPTIFHLSSFLSVKLERKMEGRRSLLRLKKFASTTGRVTISNIWDGRHILVILDSELDAMTALACPLRKVGLPLPLYDRSYVQAIVSTFAQFVDVDVDERTRACKSLRFARVCVEVDVTKPISGEVWVNLPNIQGFVQRVEVESKLTFCMKCQIHGHDVMSCRKIVAGNNKGSESLRRKDYDKDMSAKVMKEASATSRSTSEEDKGTKIDSRNKSKDQRSDEWVEVRRKKGSKSVQFIDPKPGDNSDKPILEQARINSTEEAATEVVSMLHNIVVDQLFLGESVGIISDDGNNEIDDTLALVAFHAPTNQQEETLLVDNNGSMQQGGVEDMSTTMQVDQIIKVSGDNEVADSLVVVALKESQDQVMTDSGSDAEYDHVLSITNVGGRFYCEEFGGKSFQDAEELIKYSKENGYVGYNRRCP